MCGFWSANTGEKIQLLNAATGFDISEEELNTVLMPRWITLQRAQLLLAGWTNKDDTNPPRFYEPLPSGPDKGLKVEKATEQKELQDTYLARGWDEKGIPTTATLEKLGLGDLDAAMNPLR